MKEANHNQRKEDASCQCQARERKSPSACVAAGFGFVCDWSVESVTRKSMQTAPIFSLCHCSAKNAMITFIQSSNR